MLFFKTTSTFNSLSAGTGNTFTELTEFFKSSTPTKPEKLSESTTNSLPTPLFGSLIPLEDCNMIRNVSG